MRTTVQPGVRLAVASDRKSSCKAPEEERRKVAMVRTFAADSDHIAIPALLPFLLRPWMGSQHIFLFCTVAFFIWHL